jgi:hypothetical protein
MQPSLGSNWRLYLDHSWLDRRRSPLRMSIFVFALNHYEMFRIDQDTKTVGLGFCLDMDHSSSD